MKKLLVVLLVLGMAVPAMAADWNFYGSARFATFRVSDDPGAGDSVDNTLWEQNGVSRIGATVKTSDAIGGGFEMSDSFGKRKLYGTYTFGAGQLLIGQTYTPSSSMFYSNSVFDNDGDLLGAGQFYVGRRPMIQFKTGGLKVALVSPTTAAIAGYDGTEVDIPKIEASYKFKTDMFFVDVFGGYQTFDVTDSTATLADESVDSYVVGVGGGVNMGAFYANAGVHYAINPADYGAYLSFATSNGATTADFRTDDVDGDGSIDDIQTLGYLVVVGFKASDMLTVEAGYGREGYEADIDNSPTLELIQYYVNATINIAPGFFIVPEVGFIDRGDDDQTPATDFGDITYFGAKWQINF